MSSHSPLLVRSNYRQDLAQAMNDKLGNQISNWTMLDIVAKICDVMKEKAEHDEPIIVENFGTFMPYWFAEHVAGNINDVRNGHAMLRVNKRFKTVKLNPHSRFTELIQRDKKFAQHANS